MDLIELMATLDHCRRFTVALTTSVVLLVSALPLTAPAFGQSAPTTRHDSSQPIEITADELEVQQNKQIATFTGNVNALQGEMLLRAETVTVYYRPQSGSAAVQGAISRIDAAGQVFFSSPGQTAQGDTGVYDVDKSIIVLNGNVVLTREENVIRGNRMVLNLATGRSKVEGAAGQKGGRVKGLFVPSKKKSN